MISRRVALVVTGLLLALLILFAVWTFRRLGREWRREPLTPGTRLVARWAILGGVVIATVNAVWSALDAPGGPATTLGFLRRFVLASLIFVPGTMWTLHFTVVVFERMLGPGRDDG